MNRMLTALAAGLLGMVFSATTLAQGMPEVPPMPADPGAMKERAEQRKERMKERAGERAERMQERAGKMKERAGKMKEKSERMKERAAGK